MGVLEIVLLAAGAVIFTASFCIPVKQEKLKEETRNLAVQEIKELVSEELENVRGGLSELSEEEMQHQIEKSERSMERISNEKIMAVNEYSDTVLEEIHKSHEEVVFLYDMLKNKKESLTESYGKADQNIRDLLQQVKDSEITVRENLEDITKKHREIESRHKEIEGLQKEIESLQKEAAALLAAGRTAAAARAVPKEGKPEEAPAAQERADKPAAAEAVKPVNTNMVFTEVREQVKEETPAFAPFMPEKIEAVPKKRSTRRTAKTKEVGEEEKAAKEQKTAEKESVKQRAAAKEPAEQDVTEKKEEEGRQAERKSAEKRTAEKEPAGQKVPETEPAEEKMSEMEPAEKKIPEKKPAEKKAAEKSPVPRKIPDPAEDVKKAEPVLAEENADVMLLLPGAMENKAANSNERILELHKAGKSNMAIARDLGLGIGEVKLVIDLYEGLR